MTALSMKVLTVHDQLWLVREAVSEQAALNEIAHARALGSIGSSTTSTGIDKTTTVVADVHRIKLVEPS